MKKLLILLSLAFSLSSFSSAEARSMIAAQTAEFTHINYGNGQGENYVAGNVTLNFISGKIKVFLIGENNCPINAFCIKGPDTESLSAPIVERKIGACGQIIYVATKNDMPVDGVNLTITVMNMTRLTCPNIRPMGPTVVKISKKFFDRINGVEVSREGTIIAKPLRATSASNL